MDGSEREWRSWKGKGALPWLVGSQALPLLRVTQMCRSRRLDEFPHPSLTQTHLRKGFPPGLHSCLSLSLSLRSSLSLLSSLSLSSSGQGHTGEWASHVPTLHSPMWPVCFLRQTFSYLLNFSASSHVWFGAAQFKCPIEYICSNKHWKKLICLSLPFNLLNTWNVCIINTL